MRQKIVYLSEKIPHKINGLQYNNEINEMYFLLLLLSCALSSCEGVVNTWQTTRLILGTIDHCVYIKDSFFFGLTLHTNWDSPSSVDRCGGALFVEQPLTSLEIVSTTFLSCKCDTKAGVASDKRSKGGAIYFNGLSFSMRLSCGSLCESDIYQFFLAYLSSRFAATSINHFNDSCVSRCSDSPSKDLTASFCLHYGAVVCIRTNSSFNRMQGNGCAFDIGVPFSLTMGFCTFDNNEGRTGLYLNPLINMVFAALNVVRMRCKFGVILLTESDQTVENSIFVGDEGPLAVSVEGRGHRLTIRNSLIDPKMSVSVSGCVLVNVSFVSNLKTHQIDHLQTRPCIVVTPSAVFTAAANDHVTSGKKLNKWASLLSLFIVGNF